MRPRPRPRKTFRFSAAACRRPPSFNEAAAEAAENVDPNHKLNPSRPRFNEAAAEAAENGDRGAVQGRGSARLQ